MSHASEQRAFDKRAVEEMLAKANERNNAVQVVLAFGRHRASGCAASQAVYYALNECGIE